MQDDQIQQLFADFVGRAVRIIDELSAERMVEESAINPILAKALGFKDFESLARFYVYQRIGRSLLTSFGANMEKLVRLMLDGERGEWWDVVKNTSSANYYVSVKSGPRDMNKDQTAEFSRRAKDIMRDDPKARPFIAMGYGKQAWPVITETLNREGLDPELYSFVGKRLYAKLSGDADYYKKILDLVVNAEVRVEGLRHKTIIELMDSKVAEIVEGFSSKYNTVDALLVDTF